MDYLFILGRQPELGLAELERRFHSPPQQVTTATARISTDESVDIQTIGGSSKAGRIILALPRSSWQTVSRQLITTYRDKWSTLAHKQTLGISVYGDRVSTKDIQSTALRLKQTLKSSNVSVRIIPNQSAELSSAVSHHNKLGLSGNKTELLIALGKDEVIIAESIGAQNITALARRDQHRPKRDAFVGMLPPKLALMMINMSSTTSGGRILDPFCGTGVVLQEALLRSYEAYGTDLSEKMVDYSTINLEWLAQTHLTTTSFIVHQGDAIDTSWQQPIDGVVAETYLGQPFSAPPSLDKLEKVRGNCDHIISQFLRNIASQLASGTPLCLAVPAWRGKDGSFTHLPLTDQLGSLGYTHVSLQSTKNNRLLYYREDQVVARELLILTKK